MFPPEGAKDAPSLGARTRVTPITEHEVALGYPHIGCAMKKKLPPVLLGIWIVFAVLAICASMQVRATSDECARTLAGDDLIPQPVGSVNHAITIRRPPHDVWPWLAQRGSDRAGWYAYDFIDNGSHRSAERILPDYQNVRVGSVFPALPGAKDVFVVAQCEREHSLVLSYGCPAVNIRPLGRSSSNDRNPAKHG